MSYIFHLLGSPYNDSPEFRGWWLLVNNIEAMEKILDRKALQAAFAYLGMFEIKDGLYEFENKKGVRHGSSYEYVANMTIGRLCEKMNRRVKLIEATNAISHVFTSSLIYLFSKDSAVYVNKAGGCMPVKSNPHKLIKVVVTDNMIFPEGEESGLTKVEIIKWGLQGKHWYAKVGGEEVIINSQVKWKTYKAAENAAKQFARKNNYEIEL